MTEHTDKNRDCTFGIQSVYHPRTSPLSMKKLLVVLIAILALAGSLTAYSSLIPKVPLASDADDLTVSDAIDITASTASSMSSSSVEMNTDTLTDTATASSEISVVSSSLSSMASSSVMTNTQPAKASAYLAYANGIIGNGEKAVLFFFNPKNTSSVDFDTAIKSIYRSSSPSLQTYRVDFSAESTVAKKLNVSQENTLVLIDRDGSVLKTVTITTKSDIESMIK